MGSGTTAIASMQLGRSFIGMEAEEQFYNEALQRIRRMGKMKENKPHLLASPKK